MRKELELIEKIESFLSGKMETAEQIAFEKQMADDSELKEEVKLQQEIMKGVQRSLWKQDATIALKKYNLANNMLKWGFTGLNVVMISLLTYYFTGNAPKSNLNKNVSENAIHEENKPETIQNDSVYESLYGNSFVIDASRDTVVETSDGTRIAIPGNIFVDENELCGGDTNHSKIKEEELVRAKIYTLHFYPPSYVDSLKKWKHEIKNKRYNDFYHSVAASLKPRNYVGSSSAHKEFSRAQGSVSENLEADTTQFGQKKDTIYSAVCGINVEKIKSDLNNGSRNKKSPLYRLKGRVPFIKGSSHDQNTILVFDVKNRNKDKSSIDSITVIELSDELKKSSHIIAKRIKGKLKR